MWMKAFILQIINSQIRTNFTVGKHMFVMQDVTYTNTETNIKDNTVKAKLNDDSERV